MKLTDTAITVLKRRYYLKKDGACVEGWSELCRRVARAISGPTPENEESFFNMIYNLDFLPNSPCLMNAGTYLGQLSACFVLPIEDSMEGIFGAIKNGAMVHKTGGGTGYSFSRLRPKNSSVKSTQGVASGPLSFASVFDSATETIKQGGKRRGANMGVLRCDHPDILDFIKAKADGVSFTNFNFSVAVTDQFMEAVRDDTEYPLIDPLTKGLIRLLKAREVFNLILENAWAKGDPGILFIDAANRANPTPAIGKFEATNPCLLTETPFITPLGIRRLKDLKIGDTIWSKEGWTQIIDLWSTGIKEVYQYETTAGTFRSTEDHQIVQNGVKVKVSEAVSIDTVVGPSPESISINANDVMDGLVIGDGTRHGRDGKQITLLCIGVNDQDYFDSEVSNLIQDSYSKPTCYKVTSSITPDELPPTYERKIPERFLDNPSKVCSFLRGLFSANGDVLSSQNNRRVSLRSSSRSIVETVQFMLSSVGIRSYFTTDQKRINTFSNGQYECKKSFKLNITRDIPLFAKYIGFIQQYKTDKLTAVLESKSYKPAKDSYEIKDSSHYSTEEVFDLTVDNENHTFWAFGFDTSNCGEQWLLPYESCNLGSINLKNFVVNGEIDLVRLLEVTETATIFLDNVVDLNKLPIPEIAEATKKTRKIGLGIMGLHDMLMQLGIAYDSSEGREVAGDIMQQIRNQAFETSKRLAKHFGTYPAWEGKGGEVRNATLTCIAPTGTISMIANCSSGCEPYYSIVTEKHVMDGDKLLMINDLFVEIARKEGFYSEKLMKKITDSGTVIGHKEIPLKWQTVFRTAQDISVEGHIKMQSTLQESGVDNAISKTINMPNHATKKDIGAAYMLAWELGCKGLTIYRDGSRDHQVLNSGTKATPKPETIKQDLPDVLDAKRYRLKDQNGNKTYIMVCFDSNEKPVEVFASFPFDHGTDMKEKSTMWTTTCRLVSLSLRCGIPIDDIINQLERSSGNMYDLPAQLSKLFKSFLAGTQHGYSSQCPECKGILEFKEGCETCSLCGYSKCS